MRIAATAALVLAAVLGSTFTAAAQPGMTPPQAADDEVPGDRGATVPAPPYGYYVGPMAQPMPAPMLDASLDLKSEGTASMLSLGTTAAGFALLAAAGKQQDGGGGTATLGLLALMIGPSAGHIYAGETGHAVGMSLVRTGAAIAFVAGIIKATTVASADCIDWCGSSSDRDNGATLMWVGGVTFVAASVYDLIDAPRAARRHNNRNRQFSMQPIMVGTATARTPGMGFSGRF